MPTFKANVIRVDVKGGAGAPGKTAYQSYLDTTDDDPPLSEEEWSAAGSGTVGAIDGGAPDSIYEATVISGGEP